MSEDYHYIGQMVCIALLQNGQLPVYIPEEILQAIFFEDLKLPLCVRELKCGMDTLGIHSHVWKEIYHASLSSETI